MNDISERPVSPAPAGAVGCCVRHRPGGLRHRLIYGSPLGFIWQVSEFPAALWAEGMNVGTLGASVSFGRLTNFRQPFGLKALYSKYGAERGNVVFGSRDR